jgi:diacylglycerol kinase (ATP)
MGIAEKGQKLLFIVNEGSGTGKQNIDQEITNFCQDRSIDFQIFPLPKDCNTQSIKDSIAKEKPSKVIAVGGDGTLKLVAECLLKSSIPIGILPTGSANGMAKELGIPLDINEALEVVINGQTKQIHCVEVNGQLCIHLADIGFNAYIVKKFDELPERGMLTYAKAAWSAFWNHRKMDVEFEANGRKIVQKAAMVAIANATKYGSGLQINPNGKLDDDLFEIILVKEYAVMEIIKIWISKLPWNTQKIESFQVQNLQIKTKHKVHFQVDGEYLGKVKNVEAVLLPKAINLLIPLSLNNGN